MPTRYVYPARPVIGAQLGLEVAAAGLPANADVGVGGDGSLDLVFDAPLSAASLATLDSVVAAHVPDPQWAVTRRRSGAKDLLGAAVADGQLIRAVVLVILDEINVIRTNALLSLVPRTATQVRTAIANKLDAGSADT
jgi:hypothetical protein